MTRAHNEECEDYQDVREGYSSIIFVLSKVEELNVQLRLVRFFALLNINNNNNKKKKKKKKKMLTIIYSIALFIIP